MDPATSKAADFERRASRRISRRVSVHAGTDAVGGADDGLDLQTLGLSDGFRPATASGVTTTRDDETVASSSSSSSPPPPANSPLAVPRTSTSTRPSSIAKPPGGSDSFALQHDGAQGPINEAFMSRQVDAAAATQPAATGERPYDGPSGPSFPYQMYQQNVRAPRGANNTPAASPSPPLDSSYQGARGPAFPYGLYPQNTVGIPSTSIPIGFPGMSDNYRRQVGPDGEEIADMVGPHGHTEQLPPYTRYPEESYASKGAGDEQAEALQPSAAGPSTAAPTVAAAGLVVAGPSSSSAPGPAIPGAGGIGLAARNPEFDPLDNPDSPRSRHSSRSFTTASEASHHDINTAARAITEKQKTTRRWQTYGRRRLWGIVPYWAICLVIAALFLMGIILGAVIGSFVTKHKKPPHREGEAQGESTPPVTVTVDATPIPTPSDLPPLPTGTFGLPLIPNKSPNSCFNDTTQAQAWSCQIWFGSGMTINIGAIPPKENGPLYDIAINCNQSVTMGNNVFFYGEQPPVITTPQPMQLVNDTLDPNRGPAWFNMMPYNKTVIVHESLLSMPNTAPYVSGQKIRRAFGSPGEFHRKGTAQAGDKPWVCTWPDTLLEVFIYPNQNTSFFKISLTSTYTPSATPTGAARGASLPQGATPTSGAPAAATTTFDILPPPPPYPRVVKVEERRMARSRQATCVQYHVKPVEGGATGPGLPKLTAEPIFDVNGKPITIAISEAEPAPGSQPPSPPPPPPEQLSRRDEYEAGLFRRESNDLSDCGCLWMVT